jgi:hypothetical protein
MEPIIREVDLQGNGTKSFIVIMSFVAWARGADPSRPESDEIHIYDVEGRKDEQKLVQKFVFAPKADPGISPFTPSWRFELASVGDFAHDGRREIVGNFSEDRADTADARPAMILWDPSMGRYVLTPLLPAPVPLRRLRSTQVDQLENRRLYSSVATIVDPTAHVSIRDYGTPADVLIGHRNALLVTAAITGPPTRRALELDAFSVDLRAVPPSIDRCGRGVVSIQPNGFSRDDVGHLWGRVPKETLENECP